METEQSAARSSVRRLWPFAAWLLVFYCGWLTLVIGKGLWGTVCTHWPIALAMTFGSYIAGSTPMGGGTVGFPVLVLLFDLPGSLGRNFGLAVQSVGMVSASIYIFASGGRVDWGLLRPALVGVALGMPFGAACVAPLMPDLWVKLTFAVVWASFGLMHLMKMRELVAAEGVSDQYRRYDRWIGLTIGFAGGIVASITGVGIDMMIYAVLVLLYRADLKIAIPTSVVLMAATSVMGVTANLLLARLHPARYSIDPAVFANWIAAAPVVALGAPFGALVVSLISRTPTLILVSLLCVAQFLWTLVQEQVSGVVFAEAIAGVLACNAIFHVLYRWGRIEEMLPSTLPGSEVSSAELAFDETAG